MKSFFTRLLCLSVFCLAIGTLNAQDNLTFTVNAPGSVAGNYPVGSPGAGFGFHLTPGESFSGDLAWAFGATDSLVCDTVLNIEDVAGKIALVRRGACFFSDKIHHAQTAGAIGVVICNANVGEGVIDFGAGGDYAGTDTIPSAFISYESCATIATAVDAGETVNITLSVPAFYNEFGSYSYHTPTSQIIALDAMGANLVNTTGAAASAELTAEITEPGGNVVTLSMAGDLEVDQDSAFTFEAYTPSGEVGEYTIVMTNNLTDDVLEQTFVITDHTFGPDNGNINGSTGPSDDNFANLYNLNYQTGSLAIMGENGGVATHVSFGVSNAAALFTGDSDADAFSIVLYDGDADGDNVLDLQNSFDELTAIAIGTYSLTGNEGEDQLVYVPLESLTGDAVELNPDGAYYATVQYNGVLAGTGVGPQLLSSPSINYPIGLTTPLILDQLYSGWSGRTIVTRLHLDGFVGIEDVEEVLEESKVTLAPNPVSDYVELTFALTDVADEVRVGVLDVTGRVIHSEYLENVKENTFRIDTEDFAAGTYFLSILTPEGYSSKTFVVAK